MPPKFVICEEKVCTTCHLTLPRSAYYTQRRHQYGRCKSCENKRLAKYRAEKKLADNDLQGEKRCEACQKIVPMKQIADYGICRGRVCIPCHRRQLRHKEPHLAVIRDGKCRLCAIYGKSDNCTIPSPSQAF